MGMQFFKLAAATAVVAGAVDGQPDAQTDSQQTGPYKVQPCRLSNIRSLELGVKAKVGVCRACNNQGRENLEDWKDCYLEKIKDSNQQQSNQYQNLQQISDMSWFPFNSARPFGGITNTRFGPEFMNQVRDRVVAKSALNNNNDPCQAQMSTKGMCRALMPRYTFNQDTNACISFDYGGCGASANIFHTKKECEKKCVKEDDVDMKVGRAFIPKWSFNKEIQACESVIWGGMGALNSDNFFDNEEKCKNECVVNMSQKSAQSGQKGYLMDDLVDNYEGPLPAAPVTDYHGCSVDNPCACPKNPGISFNRQKRKVYYWNASHKNCETMVYKGFNGNANMFESWDDCIDRCHESPDDAKLEKYGLGQRSGSTSDDDIDPICLQPKAGDNVQFCRALITVYAYDKIEKKCVLAALGGCDWSTKNSFYLESDCQAKCMPSAAGSSDSSEDSKSHSNKDSDSDPSSGTTRGADGLEKRCHGSFEESYEDAFVSGAHAYKVYDSVKEKCKTVYYLEERLSIGENENLFTSFPKCRSACEPNRVTH